MPEFQQTRSYTRTSANRPAANTVDGPRPYSCRCKIKHDQIFRYWTVHGDLSDEYWTPLLFVYQYPMDKNKGLKVPVQLRVSMWLGLSALEEKFNSFSEGSFSVYAEMVNAFSKSDLILIMCEWLIANSPAFSPQYENQACVLGKWGTTGLVGRHKFSDMTGKVKLKQERFLPPRGWEWEGDWFVDPARWWAWNPHINIHPPVVLTRGADDLKYEHPVITTVMQALVN